MSENSETIVLREASSEAERKAYFQPFTDAETGRECCGGQRRKCPGCSRKYNKDERLLLACPECGRDRRCRSLQIEPSKRCKFHGGMTLSGPDAPNYKGGRRAAPALPGFPKHVQQAFVDAQRSTDMTSIVSEHGLVQARMLLIAGRLAGPEAETWWKDLAALRAKILADSPAAQAGDKAAAGRVAANVDAMLHLVDKGATESDQWAEVLKLNDKSAELKSRQAQIERDHSAVLTATQALDFVRLIAQGVKEALLLVKSKFAFIRQALHDEVEREAIVRDAVRAIDEGEDKREVIEGVLARFVETIPVEDVDDSFSSANRIVQGRIKQMVE